MSNLNKVEDIVKDILKFYPRARNDDNYLFAEYIRLTKPELLEKSLGYVLVHHGDNLNFRSVIRVRAKLQNKFPEFRGEVYRKRHKKSAKYLNYVSEV